MQRETVWAGAFVKSVTRSLLLGVVVWLGPMALAEESAPGVKDWKLSLKNGAEAKLEPASGTGSGFRVVISKGGTEEKLENVFLERIVSGVSKETQYEISFLAKAEGSRKIIVGITQSRDPWTSVGLFQTLEISDKWQLYTQRFRGTEDCADPRIIFELGSQPATIELADVSFTGKWGLLTSEGTTANLQCPIDMPGLIRVQNIKLGKDGKPRLQLVRTGIPIEKGGSYTVAFQAKSANPRTINAAVSQANAPFTGLGIYQVVNISANFEPFNLPFKATGESSDARLYFDLADSEESVELSDVSLLPGDLKVLSQGGAKAGLFESSDAPGTFRIAIASLAEKPAIWHVQLIKTGLQVQKGKEYSIMFRARADKPRAASFSVSQANKPFTSLGVYKQVALTPEWKDYKSTFMANADENDARLYFDLGDEATPLELGDLKFEPVN